MKFKVTLSRARKDTGNPFRPSLINEAHQVDLRVWEFEAENENAVLEFYTDAKEKCLHSVIGFELRSIEPLKDQV